jgi:hypothetical protein
MLAWKALMSMGGRSDMKPTVSERMALRPDGSMTWRIVGSSVSNSLRTSWVKICYNVITCFSCQTARCICRHSGSRPAHRTVQV